MNEIIERLNKLFNGLLVTTFGYEAIDKNDSHITKAAACLKLNRTTLIEKMKKLSINQ